jgi:hypothetical protein
MVTSETGEKRKMFIYRAAVTGGRGEGEVVLHEQKATFPEVRKAFFIYK